MTWSIKKNENDWGVVYNAKTYKKVIDTGVPSMYLISKEMFYAKQKYVN